MDRTHRHRIMTFRPRHKVYRSNAVCDMCQNRVATEVHHIIKRSSTLGENDNARAYSESFYLLAAVCHLCHQTIDEPENRNTLLQNLYKLYGGGNADLGYSIVKTEFDKVNSERQVRWTLPEVKH